MKGFLNYHFLSSCLFFIESNGHVLFTSCMSPLMQVQKQELFFCLKEEANSSMRKRTYSQSIWQP